MFFMRKFLNTIVRYRKPCRLGGSVAPRPSGSTPGSNLCKVVGHCTTASGASRKISGPLRINFGKLLLCHVLGPPDLEPLGVMRPLSS